MLYSYTQLAVVLLMLGAASACDVRSRRIPNWLTVATALGGAIAQWTVGGWLAVAGGVGAGLGLGALLAPFWTKRFLGGGDLKLAVAAGVWVGLARAPRYWLASAVAGGILALVRYALAGASARAAIRANVYRLHVPSWSQAAESQGQRVLVPYGAAFAAGALFAICSV
jgi:prepilin peptidase CpaA